MTIQKTQAERFGDFIASSRPPIATGTVRRFLVDEHAVNIGETTVRFRDGSEIQRADGSAIETAGLKPARTPRQQIEMD